MGKTTTAVNLAACLADRKHRVLLIDLDPQANATSGLGFEGFDGCSIYGPLIGSDSITDKILLTRLDNLSIIPSDLDLAGAEIEVARLDDHLVRLQKALAPLVAENAFEYVVLDCPPSLGILMTNALWENDH